MPPSTQLFKIELLANGKPLDAGVQGFPSAVDLHAPDLAAAIAHARQMMRVPFFVAADSACITLPNGGSHTITPA